jgi:tyrosyl-tRNA synthetase
MADPDIVVRLRQGWLAHWDTDVRFVMVYASEWVRLTNLTTESADEIERLRKERDEARRRTNSILTEIDCRIEHGAESNGHLEAIRSLFKEDTNE